MHQTQYDFFSFNEFRIFRNVFQKLDNLNNCLYAYNISDVRH